MSVSAPLQMLIDAKVIEPATCTAYNCELIHDGHVAGDRMWMGDSRSLSYGDEVDHYVLTHGPFGGSDYGGSDIEESNHRSLLRDYPQFFVDMFGAHSSYGLALPVTFGQDDTDGHASDLAKVLIGLADDYPLYDEQDNSALIDERATASWEQYLRSDLQRDLERKFNVDDVDLSEHEQDFWQLCSDMEIYAEAEGHRDVIFRGIGDTEFLTALFAIAKNAGHVTTD